MEVSAGLSRSARADNPSYLGIGWMVVRQGGDGAGFDGDESEVRANVGRSG